MVVNVEKVWSEYQSSLRGFLHKNVSDADDVEDLLQEVLIKTYKNLPKVRDNKKIKSWLFQIANNTIIDFYRQRRVESDIDMIVNEFWHPEPTQEVLEQLAECVVPFINVLPKEEANLLTAIEINGISQTQYAEKMGINYSTLKSRVQKSRKMLYNLFDECCTFSIDSQGNVIDYQAKNNTCTSCPNSTANAITTTSETSHLTGMDK
nr:RNA polymerase sigma factor SigZ [Vibrio bivalvicida]